jgi:hypothetical protein
LRLTQRKLLIINGAGESTVAPRAMAGQGQSNPRVYYKTN